MPAPTVATLPSLPFIRLLTGQCSRKIMKLLSLQPSAMPKQYRSFVPRKCQHTAGAGFLHVYFCYMPHGKENLCAAAAPATWSTYCCKQHAVHRKRRVPRVEGQPRRKEEKTLILFPGNRLSPPFVLFSVWCLGLLSHSPVLDCFGLAAPWLGGRKWKEIGKEMITGNY